MVTLLVLTALTACSTKKNTFIRRVYHNVTAHYNVYWNGKEALLEAEEELENLAKDNYNKVLPVFNYGSKGSAQSIAPLLDRAIEKGSKTILRHSMEFGGKEYVKWVDDAYILLGKAYFYKQDYYSARRSFNYVMREYEYNAIKYDAMLWLARTYNQLEEFEKSEPLLTLIKKDLDEKNISGKAYREYPLIYADFYIKQGKYYYAIDHLYASIQRNNKKQLKTRLKFILAQIYQLEGDYEDASELYAQVIRRNPQYEMAFNAKINLATSYVSGTGDKEGIIKILNKMLKDEKNEEFKDQIYYALAEITLKENDDTLAIHYLKKSVQTSVSNNYQKATSALKLADIYFAMPEYELAQAYYDTTIQFLPEDYPNYKEIKLKTEKLSDLVTNLKDIQLEDSLQMVALMPEDERDALIERIIEKVIEEDRKKAEQELLAQQSLEFGDKGGRGSPFGLPGEGKWYFYNPSTLSHGYSEFISKWGKRKLEDLWRLKNKQIITFEPDKIAEISLDSLAGDSIGLLSIDPHNKEYYLKDIPITEEQLKVSNEKIINAYYNLGLIYREGLNDPEKSIASYETLLERYPDNQYQLKTYYQLYRLFIEMNNQEKVDFYKTLIITRYPDSDYAKIIEDPDYYLEIQEKENQLARLYDETYDAFINGNYFTVIDNSALALDVYGDTASLIPKFEYLKAISVGKLDVIDSLVVALRHIVKSYPQSEVQPMAQNILDYIMDEHPEFADGQQQAKKDSVIVFPFTYDSKAIHLYMLIVKRQAVKLNPTKVKISDFNKKYYRITELTINSLLLNNNQYLITVGNFKNAAMALHYYNSIKDNLYVFSDVAKGNYDQFIISTDNYPVFYKDKNIELYKLFFMKEYLKGN